VSAARRASEKRRPAVVPLPARSAGPLLLAPFSTRLPPEVLRRLRLAAPRLEMRMGEITAAALEAFLSRRGH
jgi:hypothetical protein